MRRNNDQFYMWALCPPHIYAGDMVNQSNQPKSLGVIVWHPLWIVHKFAISNKPTNQLSAASCKANIAAL